MTGYTRRSLLEIGFRTALGVAVGSCPSLLGCAGPRKGKRGLDEALEGDYYSQLTKDWDPIYGPKIQWFSRYKGQGDFHGHIRGNATPGVDYDVGMFTPIVPMTSSYLRQRTRDWKDSLYVMLADTFNPAYRIVYGHLDSTLIDERFLLAGDVMRYLGEGVRPLARREIFALSGRSGLGPIEHRWVQPPHLHITFYYVNFKKNTMVYLDPHKYGIDGGRPVFWDGETLLDGEANKRPLMLERTLRKFKEEVDLWPRSPDVEELKGHLLEHVHLLGDAKGERILDSKHFHEMRAMLKRVALEEKRYPPGTRPYSLMLKILGFSTDQSQRVILTLPFISPALKALYRKAVYEEGEFLNLVPQEKKSWRSRSSGQKG